MNLYPLDLVLAAALAWAMIFFAALPTRLLRENVFARVPALFAAAWMALALAVPLTIVHYYILLGLLCLYAWRQLRHDNAFSAKGWLIFAAGLGISLGLVLILAVTPGAYPSAAPVVRQILPLASIYLGGAVPGLAAILYLFTRRKSTQAGIPVRLVHGYARLLLVLVLARAAVRYLLFLVNSAPATALPRFTPFVPGDYFLTLLVLPALAALASKRANSPAPSTSGPALLLLVLAGFTAELLAR